MGLKSFPSSNEPTGTRRGGELLSARVERELRESIRSGRYAPGDRLPTIRELSARLDVSKATVSIVVNRLVREGLVWARQGRGTYVADRKDVMQRVRSGNLALVWTGLSSDLSDSPYCIRIYEQFSCAAVRRGANLIFSPYRMEPEKTLAHLTDLAKRGMLDGAIYFIVYRIDPAFLKAMDRFAVPVVIVDGLDESGTADSVTMDNHEGIRLGVEHLLRLGHRRIAYLNGLSGTVNLRERLEAFRTTLEEHGAPFDPDLVFARNPTPELARPLVPTILERGATAVATGNPDLARGVVEGAMERGLSVPGDLSVVTMDEAGTFRAGSSTPGAPALTAAVFDAEAMTEAATDRLMERIEQGRLPPKRIRIPMRLEERETSGPPLREKRKETA